MIFESKNNIAAKDDKMLPKNAMPIAASLWSSAVYVRPPANNINSVAINIRFMLILSIKRGVAPLSSYKIYLIFLAKYIFCIRSISAIAPPIIIITSGRILTHIQPCIAISVSLALAA